MASKLILGNLVCAIILASIMATIFSMGLTYVFQPVQALSWDDIPGVSAVKKVVEKTVDKAIDAVVPGPLKEVVKSQVGNVLPDPGKLLSDPTSIIDKVAPGSGAAKNLVKDKLTDEISRLASDPARAIDPLTGNIFGDTRQVIGNVKNYVDEFGNRVDNKGNIVDALGKIVGELPTTSTVLDPSSIVSNGQIKNGFGKILGALGSYKDKAGNTVDSSGNVKNSLGQIIAKITSTGTVSTGQGGPSGQKITSMIGSRPMATLIIPNNGAQNVNPESSVFISFNKPVMRSSVTPSTVTVKDGDGNPVPGKLEFRTQLFRSTTPYATFAPLSKLLPGETYTLTLRGGIIDSNGNNIYPRAISFTTAGAGATGQPSPGGASTVSVLRTNPTDGMTGVATDLTIRAQFSAPIMGSTVTTNTFKLTGENGQTVPGNVLLPSGPSPSIIAYDPQAALAPGKYNVEITNGITDMQGIPVMNKKWSFTTVGAAGQPTTGGASTVSVIRTNPTDGMTGVPTDTTVRAQFSAPIMGSTVSTSTFKLTGENGQVVQGNVLLPSGPSASIIAYDPLSPLPPGKYNVKISGITDMQNMRLPDKDFSFTVGGATGQPTTGGQQPTTGGQAGDTTAGKVIFTQPADRSKDVLRNGVIAARINKQIDPSSLSTSTYTLKDQSGKLVAGTVFPQPSGSNTIIIFDPSGSLRPEERYTAEITNNVKDINKMPIAGKKWVFTTR
jgi:hypothetical protein